MRRSADFGMTVRVGRRAVQPDLVIYDWRGKPSGEPEPSDPTSRSGAKVGLIVAKSVGSAVQRHRVARRLRHVTHSMLSELEHDERLVIRALPSSKDATSQSLAAQLRTGLQSSRRASGVTR